MRGEPLGEIERRRPPHIGREMAVHLLLEFRIGLGVGGGLLQLEDERHQRFGDEAATIDAEMPALVGAGAERIGLRHSHALLTAFDALRSNGSAIRAARMKARILSGSLTPGARSTPEDTSTPGALVMRIASVTLSASSPPDSMNGMPTSMPLSSVQSNGVPSPPGRVASCGARASKISQSATLA